MTNFPVNRYPQAFDALYVRNTDGTYSPITGGLLQTLQNAITTLDGEKDQMLGDILDLQNRVTALEGAQP